MRFHLDYMATAPVRPMYPSPEWFAARERAKAKAEAKNVARAEHKEAGRYNGYKSETDRVIEWLEAPRSRPIAALQRQVFRISDVTAGMGVRVTRGLPPARPNNIVAEWLRSKKFFPLCASFWSRQHLKRGAKALKRLYHLEEDWREPEQISAVKKKKITVRSPECAIVGTAEEIALISFWRDDAKEWRARTHTYDMLAFADAEEVPNGLQK